MLTRFSGFTDKKNVRLSTRLVLRFLWRRNIMNGTNEDSMTIGRSLALWSLVVALNVILVVRPWLTL